MLNIQIIDKFTVGLLIKRSMSPFTLSNRYFFRPINIEELFPDREKMDTSYVEVLRKLDTPIIVITEDSEGDGLVVGEM